MANAVVDHSGQLSCKVGRLLGDLAGDNAGDNPDGGGAVKGRDQQDVVFCRRFVKAATGPAAKEVGILIGDPL